MRPFLLYTGAVALISAPVTAAASGPAVLIIKTSAGYQFAHFSSMERCEAARLSIIAEREAKAAEMERKGYRIVVPAEFSARCVLG